jgi:altronate hydrolase
MLREELHRRNPAFDKPLLLFEQQRSASEYAMLSRAVRETFAGLAEANAQVREPASLDRLTLGVECGGSDGFSGLTANPAIGHAADVLVALGGRVILSEFPELTGVEQELVDRCVRAEVAERFMHLMRTYGERAEAVDAGFEMNPSPGNIRDGLITIAMKSAGAARKGGTSPVTAALDYPEYAVEPGLNLLRTPGGDVESTTALAGAGANAILFSTGLGTPTGNPVAPVIKVSTNTDLARRLPDLIDFDCGPIVTGEKTIPESGEELLDLVVQVACGEVRPRAVVLGQADFIPWKRGISL